MSELTTWLLERVAEDEEWARWAGAAQDAERSTGLAFVSSLASSSVTSPARVLAECASKRRIVEAHLKQVEDDDPHAWIVASGVLLRALALPYADHPNYRQEWKV